MTDTGYLIIANGSAGSAERDAVATSERVLGGAAEVETVWTSSGEELDRELADLGERMVVVAGGDGSIHLLINRLDRCGLLAETAVGVVALGTGNDLARGLDLPLDPAEAAKRIVDGRPRSAPLLRLSTGEIATNNAHLGLGVAAAEQAAALKPKLGRLAYTAGGIMAGLRHGATPVKVEVDGRTLHDGPTTATFVALGPSAGGGHELGESVELFDPLADVFVVTETTLRSRLRLLRHLATDKLRDAPSVLTDRGSEVAITVDGPTKAEVDGEFRSWSGTVTMVVEPHGWRILY